MSDVGFSADARSGLNLVGACTERLHTILYAEKIRSLSTLYDVVAYLPVAGEAGKKWRETQLSRLYTAEHYPTTHALTQDELDTWIQETRAQVSAAIDENAGRPEKWNPLYRRLYPSVPLSFWSINRFWLLRQILIPGRLCLIDGVKGNGKSDFGLLLAQLFIEAFLDYQKAQEEHREKDTDFYRVMNHIRRDYGNRPFSDKIYDLFPIRAKFVRVVTNIIVYPESPLREFIIQAGSITSFMKSAAGVAAEGGYTLEIFDEMGTHLNKRKAMTKGNRRIDDYMRTTRKRASSAIFITQNLQGDLEEVLLDDQTGARMLVEKKSIEKAIVTVQGVPYLNHQEVGDIPGCYIKYETSATAGFEPDVNPNDVYSYAEHARVEAETEHRSFGRREGYLALVEGCNALLAMMQRPTTVAAPPQATFQEVKKLLLTVNNATGERYTINEAAKKLGVPVPTLMSIVRDAQRQQGTTPQPTPPPEEEPSSEDSPPPRPDADESIS
ncbi:MAG: hypothetical protein KGI89_03100 [Euryarchaeota archaeon]|nr:hypothetical protein [Euryarchaeota archaeon]